MTIEVAQPRSSLDLFFSLFLEKFYNGWRSEYHAHPYIQSSTILYVGKWTSNDTYCSNSIMPIKSVQLVTFGVLVETPFFLGAK